MITKWIVESFFFFFAVGRGIVKSYWVKKKVKKPIVGSEKVEVLEKKKKSGEST